MGFLHNARCYETRHEALQRKGVTKVIDCVFNVPLEISGVEFLGRVISDFASKLFEGITHWVLVFESNEPIGTTHMLFRYHLNLSSDSYVGVRVVAFGKKVFRVLFTIPRGFEDKLKTRMTLDEYDPSMDFENTDQSREISPGQVYIDYPVVYSILGVPRVDVSTWCLRVEGEVETPLVLSLPELYELGIESYTVDFHCVTGWSVRSTSFSGVPLEAILKLSRPKNTARWLYVESLDGYSTVLPLEEVFGKRALVALEMNGRPLELVHGYPARLVVSHLYGWKSAKWISRIILLANYKDGYWEALGYHPRGRVNLEERFKRK